MIPRWQILAAGAGLLGVLGLGVASLRPAGEQAKEASATVERRTIDRALSFQGNVDFGRQAELTSAADATVAAVPVRVGQPVPAGALLVSFDRRDVAMQRADLRREDSRLAHWLAQVYPAQRRSLDSEARSLDLKLRQETGALAARLRATRQARGEGVATPVEVAAAQRELALASARAAAERAAQGAQRAALDQQRLESTLGRSAAAGKLGSLSGAAAADVRAPFAGTVTAVSAIPQARVGAGAHLVSLVDTQSLVITVPVPAAEVYRLSASPATCYLPRQGRSAACRLLDIVKAENGYRARFALDGGGVAERGEAGDVRLTVRGPANALVVPISALVHRGAAVGVRRIEPRGEHFVPVRALFFGTREVAVEGALSPGQRIRAEP
jgi:multidrug efflux pump subunit AcrA (membrane-fusion protein)